MVIICGGLHGAFSETAVLDHSFDNMEGWLDISALPCFRGTGNGLFECVSIDGSPTGAAVTITEELRGNYGSNYPQRGSASLDYVFQTPVDRAHGPVVIEWAMKFDTRDGMRQNNRFMVILLKDMERTSDLSSVQSYATGPYVAEHAEYATPTYHVRITPDPAADQSYIYLCYGQEIEKTGAGEYIPGFISPYSATEGNGKWSDPNKLKWLDRASSDIDMHFVHYKWVIGAEWQYIEQDGEIVKRRDASGEDPNLANGACFVGPEADMPDSIARYYPEYEYFSRIEGVRLYMRNANEQSGTWVSHIKVTLLGDTPAREVSVSATRMRILAPSKTPERFNALGRVSRPGFNAPHVRYGNQTRVLRLP
jgi:hypothetical protein